jgi:hypothetical protein
MPVLMTARICGHHASMVRARREAARGLAAVGADWPRTAHWPIATNLTCPFQPERDHPASR